MSLSWLVAPQFHKTSNGYYINHDNLMLASAQERRRLIFYYIASQTPEKLIASDYDKFLKSRGVDIDLRAVIFTLGAASYAMFELSHTALVRTRISSKPFFNIAVVLGTGMLSAAVAFNVSHIMFEPSYISRNVALGNLAEKYNFSVFDFAIAKKEARLKQLRAELTSDSNNPAHL